MRAKKANESPRLIQYLLSADRKLQRLSLKKIAAPVRRRRTSRRSGAGRNSLRPKAPERMPWTVDRLALIVGTIAVLGASALFASHQPSRAVESTLSREPQRIVAPPQHEAAPAVVAAAAVNKPAEAPIVRPTVNAPKRTESPKSVPTAAFASDPAPMVTAVEPAPKTAASVEAAPPMAADNAAAVTITGCLELDGDSYMLKDTAGARAPMSRSWRSGFLRKRPAQIELVDATHGLPLLTYVGQRVAATGTLVNREMQMRSLYRVSSACN